MGSQNSPRPWLLPFPPLSALKHPPRLTNENNMLWEGCAPKQTLGFIRSLIHLISKCFLSARSLQAPRSRGTAMGRMGGSPALMELRSLRWKTPKQAIH